MKISIFTLLWTALFISISLKASDNYWQLAWIKNQVLERNTNVRNYDWDASARMQLEKASNDYVHQLADNNSFLYAPEIEDFLNRTLQKIYPEPYYKSRFAVLNRIIITKSDVPDIQMLSNGQILISTGMLTLIENEDELIALLTQYTAQFILDLNYNSYKDKVRGSTASAFLSAFAYSAASIYLSSRSDDYDWNKYLSNDVGEATGIISSGLFNYLDKENDKFMQIKADSIAMDYLITKQLNTEALINVMMKIYNYGDNHPEYSNVSLLAHYDRYPKRLKKLGFVAKDYQIKHNTSKEYDKNIAEALTMNASLQISECNYDEASKNLDRVNATGCAIEETYLLQAIIIKNTQNSAEANRAVLKLLEQAEKVSTNNSETIDIERALLYYRMNNKALAIESFLNAKRKIENINYDVEEMTWLNKMIARCKL